MNKDLKKVIFGLKFALCCVFAICLISFSRIGTKAIEGENQEEQEHVHTEETLEEKQATCTEDGLTEGKKCSVCGEILQAQEVIAALGHEYGEWVVVKEATETENGLKEKVCSKCNDKIEEEIIYAVEEENKYDIDKITSYIISLLISLLGSGGFWILFKSILSKWTNKKDELLQSKLTELEQANIISTEQKELIISKFNDLTNNFNELTKQFEEVLGKNEELTEYIKSKIDIDEERKQQINELLNNLLPDIIDKKEEVNDSES